MSVVPSREEALFSVALAQPPAERATFLAKACGADFELLGRLATLVASHERKGSVAGAALLRAAVHEEKPGDVIGHYKLLQTIGEGGCGVVWMAEQEEPVRRRVAVKIIKLGMDTKAVVARFEAERQALAMMEHPNIAKVLDAGATATGRPFFVMELVRGVTITRYCDENHLSPTARLELFIRVCNAVQHAHQKGIIHRDLKPSNILVTVNDGAPTPKIIDFGIAKATQGRLTKATVFTAFEQFIGTPMYMSPEQAEMSSLDIDTRSDIYSLGVLLYELLTGRPPFDAKQFAHAGVDQIRQQIREVEPPRPSVRLSTLGVARASRPWTALRAATMSGTPMPRGGKDIASRTGRLDHDEPLTTVATLRSTTPRELISALRGDLDWIVMRCIEKDRTRRYDTANGLAMDIERYLRNEPVVARPASTAYLLHKLIRRHRLGFGAAVVVMSSLLAGISVSLWSLVHERAARRRAVAAEQEQFRLRATDAELRRQAEAQELAARQRAYAADMNLAQQALAVDNLDRGQDLLRRQVPAPGQRDLRGWEWRYLWQASRGDRHEHLETRPRPIGVLSFSTDGTHLAVGEVRGEFALWDLRLRQKWRFPIQRSHAADFSPREPLLAVATTQSGAGPTSSVVELWNLKETKIERRLKLAAPCTALQFSPDGASLAVADAGGTLVRWAWREDTTATIVDAPNVDYPGFSIAVSHDFRRAAVPTHRKTEIRMIDFETGTELWRAPAAEERTTALAFSNDGRLLASGAGYVESSIRLWNVENGREIGRLDGHRAWVSALIFLPDGRTLASASADQTIRLWDLPSQRLLRTFRGQKGEIYRLALHPDGRTLASGSKEGMVSLWNITTPPDARGAMTIPASLTAWRLTDRIVGLEAGGAIAEWSGPAFQDRREVMKVDAAGILDGSFGTIDAAGILDGSFGTSLDAFVYTAHFAGSQPLIAIGSRSGVIEIFDFDRRALRVRIRPSRGRVYPLAFWHNDDRLVLYSAEERVFQEWDLVQDRRIASWAAPRRPTSIGFTMLPERLNLSPEEPRALAIGFNGNALFRNLRTGQTDVRDFDIVHAESPRFSGDGRYLAVASQMGYAKLFAVPNYAEAGKLSGFILGVHSVAFSPDSTRLVTGSNGVEAVRLWDVESRLPVLTLEGRGSLFRRIAFSPSGDVLAAGNNVGLLHVWRAPAMEDIEAAEKAVVHGERVSLSAADKN